MSSPGSPTALRRQEVPGSGGRLCEPDLSVGKVEEDGYFGTGGWSAGESEQALCQVTCNEAHEGKRKMKHTEVTGN